MKLLPQPQERVDVELLEQVAPHGLARKHLKPLLEAGLVRMTNPGNPRAPNQRYVLAGVGGS